MLLQFPDEPHDSMSNAPNYITHVSGFTLIQGWWEGQLVTSSWPLPKPSHQVRRHSTPCDWRRTRLHGRKGPLPHPGSLAGHSWSELCDTATPPWEITIHHQSAGREGCEEEKQQRLLYAECRVKDGSFPNNIDRRFDVFEPTVYVMCTRVFVHHLSLLDDLNFLNPSQCLFNSSKATRATCARAVQYINGSKAFNSIP